MKPFLFIITILLSSFSFGQDSTKVKAEAPRIVTKLISGESLQFQDIEIKFVEVIEDSRCPKDVTCIWAGEATIIVAIFENGKFMEEKKVTLSPTSHLQDKIGNLFSSKDLRVSGFDLLPYPVSTRKTNMEDYYIQLEVRN